MTARPSIDHAEFLHEQLVQACPDLMRELMAGVVNTLLSVEADRVRCAGYGEVSSERDNRRNGYRHRDLDTRIETLDDAVPKLREGSFFREWLLQRRRRVEAALTSVPAACYLLGVSTRRMDKMVQSLGITRLSRSQFSVMATISRDWSRTSGNDRLDGAVHFRGGRRIRTTAAVFWRPARLRRGRGRLGRTRR